MIPEVVDAELFDPFVVYPNSSKHRGDFTSAVMRRAAKERITVTSSSGAESDTGETKSLTSLQSEPIDSAPLRPFEFLSIFAWSYRKGWVMIKFVLLFSTFA